MTSDGVEVRRTDIESTVAAALIGALNAELSGRYPEPGASHFRLDPEEVAEGKGAFLVAFLVASGGATPVGCGAIRRLDAGDAEIKRMYVVPEARGRGIGRIVLAELEAEARALGARRVVLETGERQPEAIALYTRAGYSPIPLYGEYVGDPLSVCLAKEV
jgi:putative acetyltransferase